MMEALDSFIDHKEEFHGRLAEFHEYLSEDEEFIQSIRKQQQHRNITAEHIEALSEKIKPKIIEFNQSRGFVNKRGKQVMGQVLPWLHF